MSMLAHYRWRKASFRIIWNRQRLATQVSVASPSSSQGLPTSTRANQEETDTTGFLTILVNLFEEVCLTMDLHSSFQLTKKIYAMKQNV